jgi:hypothetical protein
VTKASYPLKLPVSLKEAAEKLAKEDGVSLNQWISITIAQRVGATESAEAFFRQRAGNTKAEDILDILDKVPAGPTVPGDELPEGYDLDTQPKKSAR